MRGGIPWRKAALACAVAIPQALACLPSDPGGADVDTDHDGLSDREELEVYGTSPLMPDTDGDGYNDYQEVITYGFDPTNDPTRFNPRVADLPQMTVLIMGPPIVSFSVQLANGTTTTFDNSISDQVTVGTSNNITRTFEQSNMLSWSQTAENDMSVSPTTMNQTSVTVPLNAPQSTVVFNLPPSTVRLVQGADPDTGGELDAGLESDADGEADGGLDGEGGGPPDASEGDAEEITTTSPSGATLTTTQGSSTTLTFGNSLSTTVNPSTTVDTSISFSQQQMQQNAETATREQSLALSHTVSVIGATLKVTTVIVNNSHVAFRVSNVLLGAAFIDASGVRTPIENLELDQGPVTTFQPFALGAGEQTGPVTFLNGTDLDTAMAVLTSGRAMYLTLATYELDDSTGKPYVFDTTELGSKTALVAIDYGNASTKKPELYQVATNFDPSKPGTTASQVFQNTLYIPYVADAQTGLTAVRDVGVQASGAGHWSVALAHDEGPDVATTNYGDDGDPYDFDSIEVRAGDVLHLAFVGKGASASDGGVPSLQFGTGPPGDASYQVGGPPPDASIP